MSSDPLLVPVQLDAFVLNREVCGKDGDNGARICPITQPNYTFLRFRDFVAQNDVQGHADLHNTVPAALNSRMTDLGAQPPAERRDRYGVYLHWTLPRAYRSGVLSADSVSNERKNEERLRRGLLPEKDDRQGSKSTTPDYIEPPTRWLVIRKLDLETVRPQAAKPSLNEYEAWVIESDYLWQLDDIPADYDLQVDVSPFVAGASKGEVDVEAQTEVFIGRKTRLEEWKNDPNPDAPNISLLSSGNQLFADFQLHNSNVFSMLDNFQYGDKPNQYLSAADASYYVIGWHGKDTADPLWMPEDRRLRSERLRALFMTLEGGDAWCNSEDPSRLLCHGAMYGVEWDNNRKPRNVPADKFAACLQSTTVPAVSVGTTPLDSLITYCTARKGKNGNESIGRLEEDILAIQSLLHARDDGVEGQREAKDTVYNWNFMRSSGGLRYFLSGDDSANKPIQPNKESQKGLKVLNQNQVLLDSCERISKQKRWDMFSLWWKYITDPSNLEGGQTSLLKQKVENLSSEIRKIEQHISLLRRNAEQILDPEAPNPLHDVKSGTNPFYYRAADPTVLIGGIDQGWPADYLENVSVRLPEQVVDPPTVLPDGLSGLLAVMGNKLKSAMTENMMSAAILLVREFHALSSSTDTEPQGKKHPQFHRKLDDIRRDQWSQQQPWRPLYMEWEIEYTHIPFEYWSLGEKAARLSDNKQVRYGTRVASGKPLWEELGEPKTHDTRILSGRVLILPQPSFSLDAKIQQLFSDTPPDHLDKYLSKEQRDELSKGVKKLPYLSAPLSGLTEGLLTLSQGTHIKPENKEMGEYGEKMTVFSTACFDSVGFTKENLQLIAGNSALTPFGNLAAFADTPHCPFKPVTHGQFRFRKINIIDTFGQTLVAIDPQPRVSSPPPLYPCISDFFEPQMVDATNADTVIKGNEAHCEFIQLPPQINQNSRLNAHFVKRTADDPDYPAGPHSSRWQPASEWDNPIWGWVVTNYADYGIQFFLPDGTFYREVRFGGPQGTFEEPKWVPFLPDISSTQTSNEPNRKQFDALINRLLDSVYLRRFCLMIAHSLDSLPPTPSSYAQYLTAIAGKPLALVNMGWSLELDQPPLQNESTNSKVPEPPRSLLKPDQERSQAEFYSLQVKFGDKDRGYDGLVGYYDMADNEHSTEGHEGTELNLDTIHTYFAPVEGAEPLKPITSDDHPKFTPFWAPPFDENDNPDPVVHDDLRNRKLQVYGAIMDPFSAIHAYSSFLPVRSLQLAPWTWQEAMDNMTAFFRAGPFTLTEDVGDYCIEHPLTTKTMKDVPPNNVILPALGGGEWNWLQPYVDPEAGDDLTKPPVFNSYGIDNKINLEKPGFQNGPYNAIEGFLQLRRPIMKDAPTEGVSMADIPRTEASTPSTTSDIAPETMSETMSDDLIMND